MSKALYVTGYAACSTNYITMVLRCHIYIYSTHIITACSLGQQMCLLTVTHLKLLCSRGCESLLSVRCSTQTAGISTLKRNSPKQALPTACMNKHDQLTQAFHGLVQNLCVRTGAEICAGFYGSSVGLQHGRCAQRKLFFALLSKAKAFLTKILLSVAPDYLSTETLNFCTFICVNAHNFGTPC